MRRPARIAALGLGILVVALAAPPAWSQLPTPEFGKGPDLRIASADAFIDRLRQAGQRISRTQEDRAPVVKSQQSRLDRLLSVSASEGGVGGFDAAAARRLLASIRREVELRQTSLEVLKRATSVATQSPAPPNEAVDLDRLVSTAEDIRRHEDKAQQQFDLATRLRQLQSGDAPTAGDGSDDLADQLSRQAYYLSAAEADYAQARGLEAEALARFWRQQLGLLKAAWRPSDVQVDAAETDLAEVTRDVDDARRELAELQARTATVARPRRGDSEADRALRQDLRNAELALIDHRGRELEARLLRARARSASLRERRGLKVEDQDLQAQALTLRLARVGQITRRVEERLDGLPPQAPSWRSKRALQQLRRVLDQGRAALRAANRDLRRALTYADLRAGRVVAAPGGRAREWGFVLSILVVLAAVFLLARGYRWGQQLLESQAHILPARLRLTERQRNRLATVAVLLWPLIVAATTAALLIWPVWGLTLTVGEALRLVDRPFFFVDDTGVSLLSLVKFAFAIYAATVLSRAVREFLKNRIYPQTDWDIGLTTALDTLVHYLTISVGLIFGLRFVGVGFSALAILAGILGIGIGFGLRNITENFISGLIILAERPIKIGDFIEIGPGDLEGQVRRIRARSTTVVTRNNISVIIPNSEFVSGRVINWSHGDPKVRIAISVGVVYGSNVELVRKALLEVAEQHRKVLARPAPEVEFRAFGGSSLDFILRVWLDQQTERFRIASDLHFAVDAAFRKHGIEIAFPQLDLHLKSAAGTLIDAVGAPQGSAPRGPAATKLDGGTTDEVP